MPSSFIESSFCDPDNLCPILYECIESMCTHKSPFPTSAREIIGSILLIIALGMSTAGGMAGSFIASPILITIFNFETIPSIRITYCTLLGGSIGGFLMNVCNRRHESRKPVIDYDAVLLSMPLLIPGASVGVIANHFLPPIVNLITLILLGFFALYRCWTRGISEYRKENFEKRKAKILAVMGIASNIIQKETPSGGYKIDFPAEEASTRDSNASEEKPPKYPLIPLRRYVQFLLLLLIVVILLLLRGGKGIHSFANVEYCGGYYWMIYAFVIAACFVYKFIAVLIIRYEHKRAAKSNHPDIETEDHHIWCSIMAVIAGIATGLSGTGASLILNPLFLRHGMPTKVATATSGFLILSMSSVAVFQTAIAGDLFLAVSLYFGVLAFIGAVVVSTIIRCFMKKYRRTSLLLFVLSFVALVGAIAITTSTIYRLATNRSALVETGDVCH